MRVVRPAETLSEWGIALDAVAITRVAWSARCLSGGCACAGRQDQQADGGQDGCEAAPRGGRAGMEGEHPCSFGGRAACWRSLALRARLAAGVPLSGWEDHLPDVSPRGECSDSGPIRPVLCLCTRAFGPSRQAFERWSKAWTYVPVQGKRRRGAIVGLCGQSRPDEGAKPRSGRCTPWREARRSRGRRREAAASRRMAIRPGCGRAPRSSSAQPRARARVDPARACCPRAAP